MRKNPKGMPKAKCSCAYPLACHSIRLIAAESMNAIDRDDIEGAQEIEEIGIYIGASYFANGKDLSK